MESTEDLQSMAESIASVSPPLRVTFLMEQGLVLADSEADALAMENHASPPRGAGGAAGRHRREPALFGHAGPC